MDSSVLPTLFALCVFVSCFRPLVWRSGAHTNVWFAGWGFLLVHYAALLLPEARGVAGQALDLLAIWGMEGCGLCFLLAASNAPATRESRILAIELSVPLFAQSLFYVTNVTSVPVRAGTAALLALPAMHLVVFPRDRTRQFNLLAGAFAAVGAGLVAFARSDGFVALEIILCALFLAAAYLTAVYAGRVSRGIVLMTAGLVLWAITFIVQIWNQFHVKVQTLHALLDLPRFVVAAGTILLLLDEYTKRSDDLALHDPLTGLPNRRNFDARLHGALVESGATGVPVACLVIDLDKFKYINDTFGHPVGDELLRALAKRLSWNLGPRDMLARTGGDEFTAILVEAADETHVRFIAGAMMAAGCVPVSIGQHLIEVRISIGIAVAPHDARTTADLHRTADEAMYRAKRHGGSGLAFAHESTEQIHAV